ncbi:MAG: insulinase family protein [Deltaproteobacteria bacterium]|nr:insulinase family protein [Deltaproteobacteria bacterium]
MRAKIFYIPLVLSLLCLGFCTFQSLPHDSFGVSKVVRVDGLKILLQKDTSFPRVSVCSVTHYSLKNWEDWLGAQIISILAQRNIQLLQTTQNYHLHVTTQVTDTKLSLCVETNKETQDEAYKIISDFFSNLPLRNVSHFAFAKAHLDATLKISKTHKDASAPLLQNLDIQWLKKFYEKKIHPKNSVISIVGDIKPKRALAFIQKRMKFRNALAEELQKLETTNIVSSSFLENLINDKSVVYFKSPAFQSEDYPAFLLSYVLISQSLTHKRLDKQDFVFEPFEEISTQNAIFGWKFNATTDNNDFEASKVVEERVATLKASGIPQALYEEALWKVRGLELEKSSSYTKRAQELSHNEILGRYSYLFESQELIHKVDDASVQKALQIYFSTSSSTSKTKTSASQTVSFSVLPEPSVQENVIHQKIQLIQFPHFRYLLETRSDQPIIYASFLMGYPVTSTILPVNAYLDYLFNGTKVLASIDFQNEIQRLGIHLEPVITQEGFGFKCAVLPHKFDEFIFLLSEMLLSNPFDERQFLKWRELYEKKTVIQSPFLKIQNLWTVFMKKNQIEKEKFRLSDFKNFHDSILHKENIILSLVGPINDQKSRELFQKYFQKTPRKNPQSEVQTLVLGNNVETQELIQEYQVRDDTLSNRVFALGFSVIKEPSGNAESKTLFEVMNERLSQTSPHFMKSLIQPFGDKDLFLWFFSASMAHKDKVIKNWVGILKSLHKGVNDESLELSESSILSNLESQFYDLSQRPLVFAQNFLASGTLKPLQSLKTASTSKLKKCAENSLPISGYKIVSLIPHD